MSFGLAKTGHHKATEEADFSPKEKGGRSTFTVVAGEPSLPESGRASPRPECVRREIELHTCAHARAHTHTQASSGRFRCPPPRSDRVRLDLQLVLREQGR